MLYRVFSFAYTNTIKCNLTKRHYPVSDSVFWKYSIGKREGGGRMALIAGVVAVVVIAVVVVVAAVSAIVAGVKESMKDE